MKFTISRTTLLDALNVASKAINQNSIVPITSCFLFDIHKDDLTIAGTNMETFISQKVKISGNKESLKIAIPATKLIGLIKDLSEQPLEFSISDNKANIKSASGKYSIPVEDGNDFPIMQPKEGVSVTLSGIELNDCIDKSVFAVAQNSGGPLDSVLISISDKKITFVATNRFILSATEYPIDTNVKIDALIGPKTLSIIQSLNPSLDIELVISDSIISFNVNENLIVRAVLVAEKYPDYKSVLPTSNDKTLTINRMELLGAIKRTSQFSNIITNMIKMDMSVDGLVLNAENVDYNEDAVENISCLYEGENLIFGVNGKSISSCLAKLNDETVSISYHNERRPSLLKGESTRNNFMIVMPSVIV